MSTTTDSIYLVRARDVVGLPVVTINGGEDAAEIRDVVYDAERHDLIGFTLNKRGWFRGTLGSTLAADDVVAIGADAVMVDDEDALDEGRRDDELAPSSNVDVIGDTVVSASGKVIGDVVDVVLETGPRPKVAGYEVETESSKLFVPSSAQVALSGDNLVLPAGAEEFTANDLAGFGASVRSFRDRLAGQSTTRRDDQ